MIVSVNPKPELSEFQDLMKRTDKLLNEEALSNREYFSKRNGRLLEEDVKYALDESAKGTSFENTIELISGQRFPDIVASRFYGVEVKSTKENRWTSTGSSIMESTRVQDVERIYMTFGKLGGNPIEFRSKPYEECLDEIAVTHMPRYRINMELKDGETIFEKIGMPYDELRKLDNPVEPVAKYYRSKLDKGQSLWWAGDSAEEAVPYKISLWSALTPDEKSYYRAYGCLNFPEIFEGNYDNFTLWLASQGVINPHLRDEFSSGGQEPMEMSNGEIMKLPGIYRRIKANKDNIIKLIALKEPVLIDVNIRKDSEMGRRLIIWCDAISKVSPADYDISMDALMTLFFGQDGN